MSAEHDSRSTADELIAWCWDLHDSARAADLPAHTVDPLRDALWRLEDTLDDGAPLGGRVIAVAVAADNVRRWMP